jgi:hypothetical protein
VDRDDFDNTRDWFRFVRDCGREAARDREPREAPYRNVDECEEWYAGYDDAKES